jgi:hypothetical protein
MSPQSLSLMSTVATLRRKLESTGASFYNPVTFQKLEFLQHQIQHLLHL